MIRITAASVKISNTGVAPININNVSGDAFNA